MLVPKRDEKVAFYAAVCESGDDESALSQSLFHLISLEGLACLDLLRWLHIHTQVYIQTYLCNTHTRIVHPFMRPSVLSIVVRKHLSLPASACVATHGVVRVSVCGQVCVHICV